MTLRELICFQRVLDLDAKSFTELTGISLHRVRRGRVKDPIHLDTDCIAEIDRCKRAYSLALELCGNRQTALNWLYSPAPSLQNGVPIDLAATPEGLLQIECFISSLRQHALAS